MRIAVATSDGIQLSPHFGRSSEFIIFDVQGTAFQKAAVRTNNHTPHAQGRCEGSHHHSHTDHASHNHSSVVDLLSDCQAVLCGGMGSGAANALLSHGIRPQLMPGSCSVEQALQKFLSGEVVSSETDFCAGH